MAVRAHSGHTGQNKGRGIGHHPYNRKSFLIFFIQGGIKQVFNLLHGDPRCNGDHQLSLRYGIILLCGNLRKKLINLLRFDSYDDNIAFGKKLEIIRHAANTVRPAQDIEPFLTDVADIYPGRLGNTGLDDRPRKSFPHISSADQAYFLIQFFHFVSFFMPRKIAAYFFISIFYY